MFVLNQNFEKYIEMRSHFICLIIKSTTCLILNDFLNVFETLVVKKMNTKRKKNAFIYFRNSKKLNLLSKILD